MEKCSDPRYFIYVKTVSMPASEGDPCRMNQGWWWVKCKPWWKACPGPVEFLLRCRVFETKIEYEYPHIRSTVMRDNSSWCHIAEVRETWHRQCVAVNFESDFAHIINGRLESVHTKIGSSPYLPCLTLRFELLKRHSAVCSVVVLILKSRYYEVDVIPNFLSGIRWENAYIMIYVPVGITFENWCILIWIVC